MLQPPMKQMRKRATSIAAAPLAALFRWIKANSSLSSLMKKKIRPQSGSAA